MRRFQENHLHDTPSTRSMAGGAPYATADAREGQPHMTAETTSTDVSSDKGATTTHQGILDWVNEVAELTQPSRIHWCTGSDEEWLSLIHISEPTRRTPISYAVFCLKKK